MHFFFSFKQFPLKKILLVLILEETYKNKKNIVKRRVKFFLAKFNAQKRDFWKKNVTRVLSATTDSITERLVTHVVYGTHTQHILFNLFG